MAKIVLLVGGLTAFLVGGVALVSSPYERFGATPASMAASTARQGTPGSSVNRAVKADRGAAPRATPATARFTAYEILGLRAAAVVYRESDGRELFHIDPVSNVTIATKDPQLPEVTVHQYDGSVVRPVPVENEQRQDRKPSPRKRKLMIGCEPSFSPVAAPSLAHHTGRCMARLETPWPVRLDG